MVLGGIVTIPVAAQAAVGVPTGLAPNDPTAAPTSSTPGSPIKNVVLKWTPVTTASSYQVQVSDESGTFDTPSIDVTTTAPAFAPSASLPHADYAWRVRATGGTWSSPAYFTRGWDASPGNPHVDEPTPSTGPTLTWGAVADASYYEVQFSAAPFDQSDAPVDGGVGSKDEDTDPSCFTASTEFTPYQAAYGDDEGIIPDETTQKCAEFGSGSLYWRVRARDGVYDPAKVSVATPALGCTGVWYYEDPIADKVSAECSAWSYPTTPTFTVGAKYLGSTAPAKPTGLTISPRATSSNANPVTVTSTPAFSWTKVPNTTFYRVYQTRDVKAQTADHVWETTAPDLAPVLQLPDTDVRTYWRVQACVVDQPDDKGFVLTFRDSDDRHAVCGPVSDWATYVKKTPHLVQNYSASAPIGGYTMTWTTAADANKPNGSLAIAVTDVAGYDLQISNHYGSFDSGTKTFQVDRQGTVSGQSSATISRSGLPTGFKWRVRGVDSSGNAYPWSTPTVLGTLASAQGKLTTKSGFGPTTPLDFSFNTPVENVTTGTTKIVATSNGASFPGTVRPTGDSGSTFRFTPSKPWTAGESYRLQLSTAVQTAGTSVPATALTSSIRAYTKVDSSSSALTKVTGDYSWSTMRASNAMGGSYLLSDDKKSTSRRSYVQTSVRGSKLKVYACKTRAAGKAGLYVDGKLVKRLNLYKKSSTCGKVATISLASGSAHTVRFAALGTKVKKATRTKVRFDGFVVS